MRQNVLPEGEESVFSDTLGLVMDRSTRKITLDAASRKCPGMLRLLAAWLRDRQPSVFKRPFPFTSISVNYATVQCKICAPSVTLYSYVTPLLFPSTGTLHGCTETAITPDLRSHVPLVTLAEGDCCTTQMMMGARSWMSSGSRMLSPWTRAPGSYSSMVTEPIRLNPFEATGTASCSLVLQRTAQGRAAICHERSSTPRKKR